MNFVKEKIQGGQYFNNYKHVTFFVCLGHQRSHDQPWELSCFIKFSTFVVFFYVYNLSLVIFWNLTCQKQFFKLPFRGVCMLVRTSFGQIQDPTQSSLINLVL